MTRITRNEERKPLSGLTVEAHAPAFEDDVDIEAALAPPKVSWLYSAGVSVGAPAMGLLALVAHKYLPNRQTALPTKLYPLLLEVGIGITLFLAAAQLVWRPLRPWVRSKAPLWGGAFLLLAIWDLITLKFALMPMP